MSDTLDKLISSTPCLWKGGRSRQQASAALPTGYAQLDQVLPAGGWPLGVVIELLPESIGIGELRLLLPAIRVLTQSQRQVLMINTPYIPYAPALLHAGLDLNYLLMLMPRNWRDALWSAEKALLNPACGMVLVWSDNFLSNKTKLDDNKATRRLQVAAQVNQAILVLYRLSAGYCQNRQSPWAAVRLGLADNDGCLMIDVLKIRGLHKRFRVELDLNQR